MCYQVSQIFPLLIWKQLKNLLNLWHPWHYASGQLVTHLEAVMIDIKRLFILALVPLFLMVANTVSAQPVLVEPGHALIQIADSVNPIDASQADLDLLCAFENEGNIESIAIEPGPGLFVQISSGGFTSLDTCIFSIDSLTGVTNLVNQSTGFGINSRGTDMQFDPSFGFFVTQNQNADELNFVDVLGITGTYAPVSAPLFGSATFGMDFSAGAGGSDVLPGDIVFTGDVAANGIHSIYFGSLGSVLHTTPPTPGDDMVIQPDGDWVHVPDFSGVITAYQPFPPHVGTPSATGLNVLGMFDDASLPFVFGSRASVCDPNGMVYVSYSGGQGGTGLFRVDEALTTSTLVLTIADPKGIQDINVGPSAGSLGSSVYFTVHDSVTFGEEVWELDLACGEVIPDIDIKFCSNPNGFNCKKQGNTPLTIFGTAALDITDIDISSLRLCLASAPDTCTGAPNSWSIADRGDPTTDLGASECAIIDDVEQDFLNPDGFDDLDVAFDTQEFTGFIGCPLDKGEASPTLIIRGFLLDGTEVFSTPVNDVGIDQLIRKGGKS